MARNADSRGRPNEAPMPDPLAFFLTWTTYGTWLPGDERGWVKRGKGFQLPDMRLRRIAEHKLTEPPCTLDPEQRELVEKTIAEHCRIRGWELHAVKCRTNHVHVVVSANLGADEVMDQFKAWCTRKLKELQRARQGSCETVDRAVRHSKQPAAEVTAIREHWWTERGSKRHINDRESLDAAILYVLEAQDRKDREDGN